MLISALLLVGMSAKANAARKQVSATAAIEALSADGIAGRVSTPQDACRAKRNVTVYMVNSGSPSTTLPYGTAITSGDGTWSIRDWAYPGEYFAVITGRTTRHFLCRPATSDHRTWWTSGAAAVR
jgi:hypothetical protein